MNSFVLMQNHQLEVLGTVWTNHI